MAFITLRRSRGASSYYLVESYRDDSGGSRKRTICYLGRERDGTDTLDKAVAHWKRIVQAARRELRTASGERRRVLKTRLAKADDRLKLLRHHRRIAALAEQVRQERQRRIEADLAQQQRRAEEAEHWRAIERLQRFPTAEHARSAKRAFRFLALRLHPDQGGSHEAFIRLKTAYDRAEDAWRRLTI